MKPAENEPNREFLRPLESEGFEVVYARNLEQSYAVFDSSLLTPFCSMCNLAARRAVLCEVDATAAELRDIPILAVTAHAMWLPNSADSSPFRLSASMCYRHADTELGLEAAKPYASGDREMLQKTVAH